MAPPRLTDTTMTQNDRILGYLRLNNHLCSLAPLHWEPMITRTAARINDLKLDGYQITAHDCRMHPEGTPRHVVYELVTADQLGLF
jgi:hypothetical protein